ncbi:MAG: acyl-CoA thioesterase [Negativicutes bacterium]|nr:acyl-CoA thioesterase [Negativicutes bacterium]
MKSKTVEQSKVSVGNLMQPEQANMFGNVHGGEIMKLMDHAAGIVALRHARSNVVTARVDKLEFHYPIHIGNLVTCAGQLTFVGNSSMEVAVTVRVEDLYKEELPKVALTAFFTMVALDKNGKPAPVAALHMTNDEERKLFEEGRQRYLLYKQKKD